MSNSNQTADLHYPGDKGSNLVTVQGTRGRSVSISTSMASNQLRMADTSGVIQPTAMALGSKAYTVPVNLADNK